MANNPFDEIIEDSRKRIKENIKNMTLERAVEITNNIADIAIYNYVPNNKNEMVLKGKPTYMLGDEGRAAIKTVLQELEKLQNKNDMLIQKTIEYDKKLEKLQNETIWKKKIENKIEYYINKRDECEKSTHSHEFSIRVPALQGMDVCINKVKVLQELLEEK